MKVSELITELCNYSPDTTVYGYGSDYSLYPLASTQTKEQFEADPWQWGVAQGRLDSKAVVGEYIVIA